MTAVLDRPTGRHRAPEAPPPRAVRSRAVFVAALLGYLTAGAVLVFGFDSIMEDALSRVFLASAVTGSADPKLAAVGFVWTPLPALLMVPFAPLRALWPGLVSTGFLGVVLSATASAASVATVHGIAADLRTSRVVRIVVTAGAAAAPMAVLYAANGMTEALLLMFLLMAARRLLRWSAGADGSRTADLVAAGILLALGYLTRYEAIVAAAAATVLVVSVTAVRAAHRRWSAITVDALLIGLPAAVAFVLWAVLSWLTVGSPFEQFTSAYGNSALVASGATAGGLADVGRQLLALSPSALPLLAVAGVLATRRRDPAVLVPAAVFGPVLAFEWLLRASGNLFGFLRYQIALLPLVVVVLLVVLSGVRPGAVRSAGAALAAVLVLGSSIATSGWLLVSSPELANQEYLRVRPVLDAALGRPVADPGANGMWRDDREIAARIDSLDLPPRSVLVDSGSGFAVVAASRDPQTFLITSDDGFAAALADPPGHGIRYVLRSDRGGVDAVRAAWPDLATTSWARPAGTWPGATRWSYAWTLWSVDGQSR